MELKKTDRILWIDLLRIFSIFTMIMLHVITSQFFIVNVTSYNWQIMNLFESFVRFCVPEFIMISGIFFLDNNRNISIKKLYTKNIFRIITAFIFWSFAYAIFSVMLNFLKHRPFVFSEFLNDFSFGYYHMWFLFTLLGLYIITPLLRKITEEKSKMEYFIVLFFIFCLIFNLLNTIPIFQEALNSLKTKTNLFFVLGYSGYYVLGLYLYKYNLSKKIHIFAYILGILSIIFTIVSTAIISINKGSLDPAYYNYLLPNTFFSAIAIFLFFKSIISKIQFSQKSTKFIILVSKVSFCMYLVHAFINVIFCKIGFTAIAFNPIFAIPINSILIFAISFGISFIISKIPVLNKYIM